MNADLKWAQGSDSPVIFIQPITVTRVRSVRFDGLLVDDYFDEGGTRIGHSEFDPGLAGNTQTETATEPA